MPSLIGASNVTGTSIFSWKITQYIDLLTITDTKWILNKVTNKIKIHTYTICKHMMVKLLYLNTWNIFWKISQNRSIFILQPTAFRSTSSKFCIEKEVNLYNGSRWMPIRDKAFSVWLSVRRYEESSKRQLLRKWESYDFSINRLSGYHKKGKVRMSNRLQKT